MAYVDRRSLVLRYHVKRLFSLSQMRTRSVFHCGPRNEKQTRTLTDAEDCCEDVCIVLICGWSVDVLCKKIQKVIKKTFSQKLSKNKDLKVNFKSQTLPPPNSKPQKRTKKMTKTKESDPGRGGREGRGGR